jgi:hypothetical protein
VIIAVIAVNVMQMTGDQVVHVIAVGNYLVSATCAMLVTLLMALANVMGSTTCRVGSGGLDYVFINMAFMHEMQVSVVQIINVAVVLYSDMSAVGTMLMSVLLVDAVRLSRQKYVSFGCKRVLGTWMPLESASGNVARESTQRSLRPSPSQEVVFCIRCSGN